MQYEVAELTPEERGQYGGDDFVEQQGFYAGYISLPIAFYSKSSVSFNFRLISATLQENFLANSLNVSCCL